MSDQRFFGILALFAIAIFVIGFVVGWAVNDANDGD